MHKPLHEPQINWASLARDALDRFDGDADAATEYLSDLIRKDHHLRNLLARQAIQIAIYNTVQGEVRINRKGIIKSYEEAANQSAISKVSGKDRIRMLGAFMKKSILNLPLRNGLKLRDATPADIRPQIEFYRALSGDMLQKANFLSAVLPLVPEGEKVGDHISEDQALELFDNARSAI